MAKYAVKITETLSKTIIVEADDFESALDDVETAYDSSDIIFDADDFDGKTIGASLTFGEDPIPENDKRLEYYSTL